MNIVIVTSGHPPFDERIFYKFGLSLKKYGHNVSIVCSTEEIAAEAEGITITGFSIASLSKKDKVNKFFAKINQFSPALIICCEPLTILAAHKYKREISGAVKIIYDITEYYPHQNMLDKYHGILRILNYLRLSFFNAYVSNLADYLFIGEEGKAGLYDFIAPTVKKAIIGYYPPQKYFHYSPPGYDGKYFTLCYTGNISVANGFIRFAELVKGAASRFSDKVFIAKIIGSGKSEFSDLLNELSQIKNLKLIVKNPVKYEEFSSQFENVDLCIDLRDKNIIYNRSLPIKIFDYIASGKQFIYSDLDSFKGFEDLKEAGLMIDPDAIESALQRISHYLNHPDKLIKDSRRVHRLYTEKYNWENIESKMIDIINSLFRQP